MHALTQTSPIRQDVIGKDARSHPHRQSDSFGALITFSWAYSLGPYRLLSCILSIAATITTTTIARPTANIVYVIYIHIESDSFAHCNDA